MTAPLILGAVALVLIAGVWAFVRGSHPPPSDFYDENPYDWPQ